MNLKINSQIAKMVSSTIDSGSIGDECTTVIADKTHLANLITSLKTELSTANFLLKMKEKECNDSKEHFKRNANELRDARKRIATMEKQSENYRETVNIFPTIYCIIIYISFRSTLWRPLLLDKCMFLTNLFYFIFVFFHFGIQIRHLQENLNTHSDTIKKLEENHTILKSVSLKLDLHFHCQHTFFFIFHFVFQYEANH